MGSGAQRKKRIGSKQDHFIYATDIFSLLWNGLAYKRE